MSGSGQADILLIADKMTDFLAEWRESPRGDYEGALGLLLVLADFGDGLKALGNSAQVVDYIRTELRHLV